MQQNKKVIIALGYFDSVHKGHQKVINRCKEISGKSFLPVVFTFKGNLKKAIGFSDGKNIFNSQERLEILNNFGIENVYFAPVSKKFLSMGKLAFLNFINTKYDIAGYVCGSDYRFGKSGQGDTRYLEKYAKAHNQSLEVVDILCEKEEKISTTQIKRFLSAGEIEKANSLFGFDYFLTGEVFRDRQVGSKLGYPTMNMKTDKDRFLIKEGVYAGYVKLNGKRYKACINYGARPTFDLDGKLIETHILDFNGNLYGKTVKVYFTHYIRGVKKFNSVEELKEQIRKDVLEAKYYD